MHDDLERLRQEAQRQQRNGQAVVTDLQLPAGVRKGIPPPGIAYSPNFARSLRMGAFATQVRE